MIRLIATSDGVPRFSMVAYTGGAMVLPGFNHPVVVDLAGMFIPSQKRPALRDHKHFKVVGHTEAIGNNGKTLTAEGLVSGTGPDADEVRNSAGNGFPWQCSIGASADQVEFVDAGQTTQVNGKSFTGPLYVARKSTLQEISFVPLGADGNTEASIAAALYLKGSAMTFEDYCVSLGFDPATLSDEVRVALEKAFAATNQASTDTGGAVVDMPASHESARIRGILAATYGDDLEMQELRATAIRDGLSPEATQRRALSFIRASRGSGVVGVRGSGPNQASVIEASLIMQSGVKPDVCARWYGQNVIDAALSGQNRKLGLHGAMRAVIASAGMHAPSGRFGDSDLRTAFEATRKIQAAGFSTVSLPGILSNVANKSMLASFMEVPTTYRKFCRINSNIQDFKQVTRYRLTAGDGIDGSDTGRFEEIGAAGEIPHATLIEDSQTNRLKTYGKMLAITRRDLINDDLSALTNVPKMLGRMGAISLERAVFTLLLANTGSFFHTNNGNIKTGAGSALALAGLEDAEQAILEQLDDNDDPAMITPQVLLIPPALTATARQLMNSALLVGSTTADTLKPSGNSFEQAFEIVIAHFLSEAVGLSGADDRQWYLTTGSNDNSVIEVGFLQGKDSPTVEDAEADFHTLGMQFRAFWDYGVAFAESRGGVMNEGHA